jgi:hypothetical protein
MEVLGYEVKEGTYEGNSYKNLVIYTSVDPRKSRSRVQEGQLIEVVKIAYRLVDKLPDVGDTIDVRYDRYGRAESVTTIKAAETSKTPSKV